MSYFIPDWIKIVYYRLTGARPFSRGYFTFKHNYIKRVLEDKTVMEKLRNKECLPRLYGHGLDERVVEYPWVLSKIPKKEKGHLLDAGSTMNFKEVIESEALQNKIITIININPEKNCFWREGVSYVFGDIRNMPFKDSLFDWITCISTLEHIGMDNTVIYTKNNAYRERKIDDFQKAVHELKRVLKKGRPLFITVPFGKYHNFGWFQQFDSKLIKKIIEAFQPTAYAITYYQYKNGGWNISKEGDCQNIEYRNPKEACIAGAGAVACLELIK